MPQPQQLAFPLGGIGTGNVSLGARGDLRDWEIFNKPAKGNSLANSFFAIRVEPEGEKAQARVLEGPLSAPHTLSHGYHPVTSAGLPRFAKTTFRGEYPFAAINFEDPTIPADISLEAFTPLIPLNPEDSGIPCAILSYTVKNTSNKPIKLSLVGSLINPVGGLQLNQYQFVDPSRKGKSINEFRDEERLRGLFLHAEGIAENDLDYGSVSLVTDHSNVSVKPTWQRGAWFDFLREFWNDFASDGLLDALDYKVLPEHGNPDTGSLCLVDKLEPSEEKTYRFILSWYFPNRLNSWERSSENIIRNHYATRFDNAWSVADYVLKNFERLHAETRTLQQALFSTSLPSYVVDALSANIVPLRSHTCFWLEDGRFYGWEGCFDDFGCCAGSCTHVWSYAYTLAYLFPSLERSMRETEFLIETEDDGYMTFRTFKTFGETYKWQWGEQKPEAAVDGQMGCILRVYREWLLCGNTAWLKMLWPAVKRALDFAAKQWDTDGDGVLDGRQHNTYDIEFYGPNPLSMSYYLAALRAAEEMAKALGEEDIAQTYRAAFETGSSKTDALLFNGEYYRQGLEDVNAHMYQHGEGCLSDQLLGQLHARILNLDDLLPKNHIKSTLKAIFDHNFRQDFHDHINPQRTYVLNDERGLLLCSWPEGGEPDYPFVYSDEVWTGIEYQVAANLIYEGWLKEGLEIVQAVRERHDGIRRNPWNEVECGHHYARSMASWAVLLAASGFQANMRDGVMSFDPVLEASTQEKSFSCFWSTAKGWGLYSQTQDSRGTWQPKLDVLGGDMAGIRVKALRSRMDPVMDVAAL